MAGAGRDAVAGALLGALAGDCVRAPYEGTRPVTRDDAGRRVSRALSRPVLAHAVVPDAAQRLSEQVAADVTA